MILDYFCFFGDFCESDRTFSTVRRVANRANGPLSANLKRLADSGPNSHDNSFQSEPKKYGREIMVS